ncbi:serine protease inhibitor Kazal-type 1-like [Discoglossus pictus]
MKLFLILSLLTAVIMLLFTGSANAATGSANEREPNCDTSLSQNCPKNILPVCGTDGESYANECLLCVENRKKNIHVRVVKDGYC